VRQHVESAAAHWPRRCFGTDEARDEFTRQPPMCEHRARLGAQSGAQGFQLAVSQRALTPRDGRGEPRVALGEKDTGARRLAETDGTCQPCSMGAPQNVRHSGRNSPV